MILSSTYELQGPAGHRAVFGATEEAKADADFIGYPNPDSGVTGLDSPALRKAVTDRVEGDGALLGDFYAGPRSVTFSGVFWPPDMGLDRFVDRRDRFLGACRALRDYAVLAWEEPGRPKLMVVGKADAEPRVGGRLPKTWAGALVCGDPRKLSYDARTLDTAAGAATGVVLNVVNLGDGEALPIYRFYGPSDANPGLRLYNQANGRELRYLRAVAAGEWVDFDLTPLLDGPQVVDSAGADRISSIDFQATNWPTLAPSTNLIAATWTGGTAANRLIVRWRDAWD